jgi:biopolymer transport protein ExbD
MARRFKPSDDPGVVLPITPMLDMAFQLLAFFIFTYHPSDLEGQMELNLPDKPEAAATEVPDRPVPSVAQDEEPKVEADISVLVRTQHDGKRDGDVSQIVVREGPDEVAIPVDPDDLPAALKALLKELTGRREKLINKEGIKLQADGKLKWAKFVSIMDVCRKAGFKDVGFAPPPDLMPST